MLERSYKHSHRSMTPMKNNIDQYSDRLSESKNSMIRSLRSGSSRRTRDISKRSDLISKSNRSDTSFFSPSREARNRGDLTLPAIDESANETSHLLTLIKHLLKKKEICLTIIHKYIKSFKTNDSKEETLDPALTIQIDEYEFD